jgi:hypothetical protein
MPILEEDPPNVTTTTAQERPARSGGPALLEYLEALWQDVQRAGERPDVGEKYRALATVRELTRSLTAVAFDAIFDRQTP